jgi:hypothetical protein
MIIRKQEFSHDFPRKMLGQGLLLTEGNCLLSCDQGLATAQLFRSTGQLLDAACFEGRGLLAVAERGLPIKLLSSTAPFELRSHLSHKKKHS